MTTAHKSRVLDMTRGDPFRLVLQFSLPLFCSNMLQQVYNLTDTALAGHLLGSAALAEIGATAALYGLIMNFAFGMNNGLALTVSRCFGAGGAGGHPPRRWLDGHPFGGGVDIADHSVAAGARCAAAGAAGPCRGVGRRSCLPDRYSAGHSADDAVQYGAACCALWATALHRFLFFCSAVC